MHTMNAAQVKTAFEREAMLLGSEDMVPENRVAALLGKEAIDHVKRLDRVNPGQYTNGYGVGNFTLMALTFRGFQAAASWYNVHLVSKESETVG